MTTERADHNLYLEACPFCGGRGIVNLSAEKPYVYCESCDVHAPGYDTMEEAIKAWNRRSLAGVEEHVRGLQEEIAALKQELKDVRLAVSYSNDVAGSAIQDMKALGDQRKTLEDVINALCSVAVGYQNMPGYTLHPMLRAQIQSSQDILERQSKERIL